MEFQIAIAVGLQFLGLQQCITVCVTASWATKSRPPATVHAHGLKSRGEVKPELFPDDDNNNGGGGDDDADDAADT